MEVVTINGQTLAKVKAVGLLPLHTGIKMEMSASLRPGFRLEPVQQNFPKSF
jgi:hypothetical protein